MNNWRSGTISQVCNVVAGGTPSTAKPEYWNGEIPWITPMDLSKQSEKYIVAGSRSITERGLENSSAEIIPVGSVIMSSRAPIGYLAINNQTITTNQGCKTFVCGDDINSEYLYYYLSNHMDEVKRLGSGSTFAEVGKRQLENLSIRYPDTITQKKIANILSAVDEEIQKTNQIIQKSEDLKRSLMQTFFINDRGLTKKIGDIAEVLTGGTPKTSISGYWGGSVRWMSSGEVNKRRIKDTEKRITSEGLAKSNARLLPVGTVMVALAGQGKTRGKVAILEVETTCNQSLAGIITDKKTLLSEFLLYNLEFRYQELRGISGGEGRSGLNLTLIKDFPISIPSIVKQNETIKVLKAVDDMIAIYIVSKERNEALKRGLMDNIFSQKVQVN